VTILNTLHQIATHPANKGKVVPSLARYFNWQISKRLLGTTHRDIDFHGLKLRCHADSHSASAALYFNGMPDYREMRFMQRYLRAGDSFLDVGANVGVYTLLAAALVGPTGRVDAFEPGEKAMRYLTTNVELNQLGQVAIHAKALSDSPGIQGFRQTADDCTATLAVGNLQNANEEIRQIPCTTLDDYAPYTNWAMAKLDVEGAEPLILRGARAHLARGNPPVLQIEMDGYSSRFGYGTDEFIEFLKSFNYGTAVYSPEDNAIEMTSRPWEFKVRNPLALNLERINEVAGRLGSSVVF
jgi:FkbM family methyltransferase